MQIACSVTAEPIGCTQVEYDWVILVVGWTASGDCTIRLVLATGQGWHDLHRMELSNAR